MLLFTLILVFTQVFCTLGGALSASKVLELSERFLEIKKDGIWLIKFYAPWCGYCKKLEPIFSHVAQALHDTPIRVARVDCTRFPGVATEFKVNGYPTIIFMKGDERHVYNGDRETEEIVQYAKRMSKPPVLELGKDVKENFDNVFEKDIISFSYVGEREGPLWEAYNTTAVQFQPYNHFYYIMPHQLPTHLREKRDAPFIFVGKETEAHFYEPIVSFPEGETYTHSSHLSEWVTKERHSTFTKVTRANFQQLLSTKKYLVMAVVEEDKLLRINNEMQEFKDMVESVIREHKNKYRNFFQFGWVASPELANSIAMTTLPIPSLLVVNSTSYHHHIPDDEPHHLTHDAIVTFLEQLLNESVVAYGGNGIHMRFYRSFYEARTSLRDMWVGNPILTTVLFGLPLGFLSLIFYSIFCSDIMDAPEEDEDEDLLHHDKRD